MLKKCGFCVKYAKAAFLLQKINFLLDRIWQSLYHYEITFFDKDK